ncbi:MAG: hypothetical protein Q9181_000128 [Wetmoreana brouardii]
MTGRSVERFDSESGQIYTEWTCRAGPMAPDWTTKTRGKTRDLANYVHVGPGCSSLHNMSIRSTLVNSFLLSSGDIEALPKHLTQDIWHEAKQSEVASFRLWKVFASLSNGPTDDLQYKKLVSPDFANLNECLKQIATPSFAWITFLTLRHVPIPRNDLIQISRLTSLGMLSIDGLYDRGLDDSVVRAWSRAATEAAAFTKLRFLVCRYQWHVTGQIFTYFQDFPALSMLLVTRHCHTAEFEAEGKRNGWHRIKGRRLPDTCLEAGTATWQDMYNDTSDEHGIVDIGKLSNGYRHANDAPPVVDFIFGDPRGTNSRYPELVAWSRGCSGGHDLRVFVRKSRGVNDGKSLPKQATKRLHDNCTENENSHPKKRATRTSRQQIVSELLAELDN